MMKKAFFLGILASAFFAATFVLNRSMNLGGGYWMWSASLRYLFTLPILFLLLLLLPEQSPIPVLNEIRKKPMPWVLWSTVGFGFFYLPLTLASVFGESWLVAASWQMTIVCGVLLTPLFGKQIPIKNLVMSFVILAGIAILQLPHFSVSDWSGNLVALVPILVAAFSYPLGNRKMMTICSGDVTTLQRVFGMTLCSMPFWILVSIIAVVNAGLPSHGQIFQSLIVAVFSGIIATVLFFKATDLVKNNARYLALVEATQCGEVIFTLLGGILILGDSAPSGISTIGLILVIAGMIINSLLST